MRLPDVLDASDLPLAELCASRLDGELFGLGDAFRPVDYPDDTIARALSLARALDGGRIAHRETAAWILGATPVLPRPLAVCVHAGRSRSMEPRHGETLAEAAYLPEEVATIAGVEITTPLRTVIDLLRLPLTAAVDLGTIVRLLDDAGLDADLVRDELLRRRFQRERVRAFQRLQAVETARGRQPADTRYTS